MKNEAMLWNRDKTKSVKASKIREFAINPAMFSSDKWVLHGWFNSNESFEFGLFDTAQQARSYLVDLHSQIEGERE